MKGPKLRATWLTFIISPIVFSEGELTTGAWSKALTDWQTISLINNRIVEDANHALQAPDGLSREVARRSRSWEVFHYLDAKGDLAIQLLAAVGASAVDERAARTRREIIDTQTLPWSCPRSQLPALRSALGTRELQFTEIISHPKQTDTPTAVGYIAPFLFAPDIGLFSSIEDWHAFALGPGGLVRRKLGRTKVSGHTIDRAHIQTVLDRLLHDNHSNNEGYFISARDDRSGVPIIHTRRLILVERFRRKHDMPEPPQHYVRTAKRVQAGLRLAKVQQAKAYIEFGYDDEVMAATIAITPSIDASAQEVFESNRQELIAALDAWFPRPMHQDTAIILKTEGQLYFET